MSFGIALAGGGSRGAAHVGVLLALEEAGLPPDSIAGTSAGGIVAGLYVSGLRAAALKEIVLDLSRNGKYLLDFDLGGLLCTIPSIVFQHEITLAGLIKGNRLEKYLWSLTEGKTMAEADRRVVIPAVDLISGQTIAYTNSLKGISPMQMVRFQTEAKLSEAMRASSAVPAVFVPKAIGDFYFVDGGVTNVLPVNLLRAAGVKKVVAVDLADRYQMPEKKSIVETASHSFTIMSSLLKELTAQGERILLKPPLPPDTGLFRFEEMPRYLEDAYRYTMERMPSIEQAVKGGK